jgi:sec-independent protein translocase protein TatA
MDIGPTELLIILFVVILIFGPGRLIKLGSELGRGIREFRQGLQGDEKASIDIKTTTDVDKPVENTSKAH